MHLLCMYVVNENTTLLWASDVCDCLQVNRCQVTSIPSYYYFTNSWAPCTVGMYVIFSQNWFPIVISSVSTPADLLPVIPVPQQEPSEHRLW